MAEQPPAAIPSAQEQNELPTYGTGVWISYKIDFRTQFEGLRERVNDVETYYLSLSNLYMSPKACSLDRDRWTVAQISTYKATNGFEHESLVVEVECEGAKVYLRIERRRSKSKINKTPSNATPKTQASDDSDSPSDNAAGPPEDNRPTGGSSSSLSPKVAYDTIKFSETLKGLIKGEECIEVVRFSKGKRLSLSQITVLARCVNTMEQSYTVLKANCYWFAHLVVRTAGLIEPDCQVESISKKKPGEFLNFQAISKSERAMIKDVKVEYDKKWAKFNDDIHKAVNNENSPIYKQALQREEEERKAKEEERNAKEEEKRKREEAERKAEQAEERIKKLEALLAAQATNGAK
ncbi:hypothetical protein M378DRAFT_794334 [Amanita muscaria Koide BX008]|uniref:Uncharacterized protein n=1 Tax=Amanita muscaria (strain Koide BX008) TaxID=946122 RepID=A0A0C2WLH5_AMAMK|nr:hypothetical protein M378DRAFT_794334 [Amanita muscaria Koide BX008]